ncbi:hypothetical protein DSCO28_11850 [Desulfosarcina ovata subsp. sediminis]|uniref:NTP pyrophosphohydrolase MazG-like domain-containing protein n=1 Tax=Desulfosarcina ovata subsp. sediminis TaxID=885957 RepID=A0A5K7ZLS9_9BACT|nr:nucleoside triphosphate pyrophosphohydrolase [Desulfosarcina ovata]BBO80619.1 hypothetical protein DSCO28_11850 [Desulfosarcina ovata subsp. sediminis]
MANSLTPPPSSTPIHRIVELIQTLMGEQGCPWDKKQTPETISRYLIEEVYELVDAVISKDVSAIREETGDVLFQLFFMIHLFNATGAFSIEDVVQTNIEKMVRRHPHVFGHGSADTPEKVSENWERIKREEKGPSRFHSVLESIPQGMPAILRAAMVSERAAKTGFDWDDIHGVMAKAVEEWEEFSKEINVDSDSFEKDNAAVEFGDILFTLVNVARFAHIHPETALVRSIQKFETRFRYMEMEAAKTGRDINDLTFQEMHRLWDEAKAKVG